MKKIIATIIFSLNIYLQAQIVTDRPDFTESAMAVPKGSYQLESGMARTSSNARNTRLDWSMPNVLLRRGLSDKLELRMFLDNSISRQNMEINSNISGVNNLELGFKYAFMGKDNPNQFGILGHWFIPTDDFSTSYYYDNFLLGFLASNTLGKHWSVGYNLVYQKRNLSEDIGFATVSLVDAINAKWSFFTEYKGEIDFNSYWKSSIHFGFTYLLYENLQIDFSYATSSDEVGLRTNYLSSGVSFLILPKK